MPEQRSNSPLNIMEYSAWVSAQKFKNPYEHHQYVSREEQDFLQDVIYPMFYEDRKKFKKSFPFPLVLENYSSRKPKYVIDNNYFTIVFFSYDNHDDEMCWEVSVHIKDHSFCDQRIKVFKSWYAEHYGKPSIKMAEMPESFLYPELKPYDDEVQDFCIEFWNVGMDFMLFKLLDLFRIF